MAARNIHVATLNINWMKTSSTQCQFLQILNSYNFYVIFIQETYVDNMSLANSLKNILIVMLFGVWELIGLAV